ncbi:MAG: hypothetical protein LBC58_00345 [Clostridiales Family XIII bacterium]|jgi:hypothetical protein|nr:hypothetical protein [Clostridiales Family XIII bacterium]
MKLFFLELKKILRPVPLLLFAAFTAAFSYVVISSPFSYMTEYHETSDYVAVYADVAELYGPRLEPEELTPAIATLTARYTKELEAELARNPLYAAAGVTDYESYKAMDRKVNYALLPLEDFYGFHEGEYQLNDYAPYDINEDYTLTEAEQKLADNGLINNMYAPAETFALRLRIARQALPDEYNWIDANRESFVGETRYAGLALTEAGERRIAEIYDSGEIRDILPAHFMDYVATLLPMLALMLLGSLGILLAPAITRDNMAKMTPLQYSSKTGRRALKVQLAAMLTVAVVIAVLEVGITLWLFIRAGFGAFLESGVNSFATPYTYNWFTGTYGQYFLIVAGLMLVVAIAAALLVFLFSKLSANYISLLLSVVPLTGILLFAAFWLFFNPFAIGFSSRTVYQIIPIPYVEAYICGLLLLIGIAAAGILLRKQRRAEI